MWPDRKYRIRLAVSVSVPYFQRRPRRYCAKPAQIITVVRFLGKRIWSGSKPVCKSHRAWLWQNATDPLPVSHFQDQYRRSSTDGPDHIEENQAGSDLVLADCVRFWPNVSGPETSRCASFWPMLPSQSGLDMNRIRHIYWDIYISLS